MPYMTLNGYTIPIVSAPREEREFGYRGNAFSGRAIVQRRRIVSVWNCKTKPLKYADAEAVKRMIRGEGLVWGFDQAVPSSYYSSSGFGPATAYGTAQAVKPVALGVLRQEYALQAGTGLLSAHDATKFGSAAVLPVDTANAIRFDPISSNLAVETLTATSATASAPVGGAENSQALVRSAGVNATWETAFATITSITVGQRAVVALDLFGSTSPSVTVNLRWYDVSSVLQDTDSATVTASSTRAQRIQVSGIRDTSAYTKLKIEVVDTTSGAHTILVKDICLEGRSNATGYMANGAPRTVASGLKYNIKSWAPRFASEGFTALCWTPHPDITAPGTQGLFRLAEVDGGSSENYIGLQYASTAAQVTCIRTGGATNSPAIARDGAAWQLTGIIYRPVTNPTNPLAIVVDGAVATTISAAALGTDVSKLFSFIVGGASVSAGAIVNPASCPIDELMFFPFEVSDTFLAFLKARTTGFGSAFPKALLSGDIINSRQILVTGQVKNDEPAPHALAGAWNNNAHTVEFTLMEV